MLVSCLSRYIYLVIRFLSFSVKGESLWVAFHSSSCFYSVEPLSRYHALCGLLGVLFPFYGIKAMGDSHGPSSRRSKRHLCELSCP